MKTKSNTKINRTVNNLESGLNYLLSMKDKDKQTDAVRDIAFTIYKDCGSDTAEQISKIIYDCVEVNGTLKSIF